MTYEEALKIIEAEYETLPDSPHNKIIRTGLTYNGFNSFCVSIYTDGESVILTDLGETKEVFDEVTEGEWRELCEAHGFEFRHWRIVKVASSPARLMLMPDESFSISFCKLRPVTPN